MEVDPGRRRHPCDTYHPLAPLTIPSIGLTCQPLVAISLGKVARLVDRHLKGVLSWQAQTPHILLVSRLGASCRGPWRGSHRWGVGFPWAHTRHRPAGTNGARRTPLHGGRGVVAGITLRALLSGCSTLSFGPLAAAPKEFLVSCGILRDVPARFVVLREPTGR